MNPRLQKLRLALIVDIMAPVPPKFYGGAERVVDVMVRGLKKRGHDVTLFASDDSDAPCHLIPFGHRRSTKFWIEWLNTARLYFHLLRRWRQFDLIHCFGRTLYLLPLLPLPIPKIQTYACPLNHRKLQFAHLLSQGSLTFVGCSRAVANSGAGIGSWHVIPNGVELEKFDCASDRERDVFLLFLGRLHPVKGAHTAIKVAKQTGRKLIIAGSIAQDQVEPVYFQKEIAPYIDGNQIRYIGPVDDKQKKDLMNKADALLFPIEWEEPFGLVIIEALACGTPVIAFNRGAVSEVLTDGLDGFICSSFDEMVSAVHRIHEIDRAKCRQTIEKRFSANAVVEAYERLYEQLIFGRGIKGNKQTNRLSVSKPTYSLLDGQTERTPREFSTKNLK